MGRNMQNRDLTGRMFGALKAIRRVPNHVTTGGNSIVMWECECRCGRKKIVSANHLRSLHTRSCGKCGAYGPSHELDDLTGQEFGFLRVVKRAPNHVSSGGNTFAAWECECECGEHIVVTAGHLKTLHTTSCGRCGKYDRSRDFSGEHIGRLKVLEKSDEYYAYPNGEKDFKWVCQCDCGNIVVVRGNVLRNKRFVQSCGCWRKEESIRDEDMIDRDFGSCHVVSRANRISVGGNSTVDAWNCICKVCGSHFVARGPQLRFGKTVSCGCLSTSRWELWASQFLDECGLEYTSQKIYPNLFGLNGGHLSYDFCIHGTMMDILLECQGVQHYKPVSYFGGEAQFIRQQEHDRRKREYAANSRIPLIELNCAICMTREEYCDIIRQEISKYIQTNNTKY